MPDNTQRFTGRVEDYSRYRQPYPAEEVLARLRQWCGLTPEWLVADIGAGTGMVAEVFLGNGNPVVAIEPNAEMLAHMHSAFAPPHPRAAQLKILEATAEATTLSDASVDLIAIGRAFHWFDRERALAEFRRILKPTGWVTIVAMDRDRQPAGSEFREQVADYERVLGAHGTDYTHVYSGYRRYENMETFLNGEMHQVQLHATRSLDWETFRGQTLSLSVAPHPGHPNHEAFAHELRRHFEAYARGGELTIPTICWITAGRFATYHECRARSTGE